LLERLPSVREQFLAAKPALPFVHAPRLSFRSAAVAGDRWALLPSAAGFVDPLLSTGFPLTLLGVERLAVLLEEDWQSPRLIKGLQAYETQTLAELDTTAALIGALYANMDQFDAFAALSKLYFAAAMFAETMRRLGQPQRVNSFLLMNDPKFGPALSDCIEKARRRTTPPDRLPTIEAVLKAIEPFDLAGLGDSFATQLASVPRGRFAGRSAEARRRTCGHRASAGALRVHRELMVPRGLRRPRGCDTLRT